MRGACIAQSVAEREFQARRQERQLKEEMRTSKRADKRKRKKANAMARPNPLALALGGAHS